MALLSAQAIWAPRRGTWPIRYGVQVQVGSTPILVKASMILLCPAANPSGTFISRHLSMSMPAGLSVARTLHLAPMAACSSSHSVPASPRFA